MARPADPHARASLVAAARQEFVRVGIQRARIEDITARCGLSKGAFYLHFESKEALFREVVAKLMVHHHALREDRDQAYLQLVSQTQRSLKKSGAVSEYMAALAAIDAREDRRLLEMLWEWRDVLDVLLHGSQGTEFEGAVWAMLDQESERVVTQLGRLEKVGLVRADVPADLVGMMIVGTYLLVARRFSRAKEQPDFDHWVRSLQSLIATGVATPLLSPLPLPTRRAVPRRATTSPRRKKKTS